MTDERLVEIRARLEDIAGERLYLPGSVDEVLSDMESLLVEVERLHAVIKADKIHAQWEADEREAGY